MFSGICNLSGTVTNVPVFVSLFQDNHSKTVEEAAKLLSITVKDLDFSLTPITSPGFN